MQYDAEASHRLAHLPRAHATGRSERGLGVAAEKQRPILLASAGVRDEAKFRRVSVTCPALL